MYIDANNSFYFVHSSGLRAKVMATGDYPVVGSQVVSTNVIDLGGPGAHAEVTSYLVVRANGSGTNALATSTAIYFDLYTDSAVGMGTKSLVTSLMVPIAVINAVTASVHKILGIMPLVGLNLKRYLALYSYGTGATSGTVNHAIEAVIVPEARINSWITAQDGTTTALEFLV